MKNHNRPPWFGFPLFGVWSGLFSLIASFVSIMHSWPLILQLIFPIWVLLCVTVKLICFIMLNVSEMHNARTKRKIREADAEYLRATRVQSFTESYAKLLSQSTKMSEQQFASAANILAEFYNLETPNNVESNVSPPMPYSTAPPKSYR